MGALLQPRLDRVRKQPTVETISSRLDQYGRDAESAAEKLRTLTDYESDAGYTPHYHAWGADIPRLCGQSSIMRDIITQLARLSIGRPRGPKEPRPEWTLPFTFEEMAALCCTKMRNIQREMADMAARGMIALKKVRQQGGGLGYTASLLYRKWREIEDYAVWRSKQVSAIDAGGEEEPEADEDLMEVSHDAVRLVKSPQTVRPGRASRASTVTVGVRRFRFQNTSSSVDATFDAVVQSGELVVSARFNSAAEDDKKRLHCRANPANEGSESGQEKNRSTTKHPREVDVIKVFTPLLQASGARPISTDKPSLRAACLALGDWPTSDLVAALEGGPSPRARGVISSAKHVAVIISDLRAASIEGPPLVSRPRGGVKDSAERLTDYAKRRFERDGEL